MASRYKAAETGIPYFLTLTVARWVDVFTRLLYREIVMESLRYCIQQKGLRVHGYVIMSNHLHLIAQAGTENNLNVVLGDFKKYTARNILSALQETPESRKEWMLWIFSSVDDRAHHNLWQNDNHPVYLESREVFEQKLKYLHENPVRAGLVAQPEHYLHSSASNYARGHGVLAEVEVFV